MGRRYVHIVGGIVRSLVGGLGLIARACGLAGLVLVLAAALVPGPAAGHGDYISSTPPLNGLLPVAPDQAIMTLTEPIQPGTGVIRIANATGQRFDLGVAKVLAYDAQSISVSVRPLPPGVYTVTWTATSTVDGHVSTGVFQFMVLNPDGSRPGSLGHAPERSSPWKAPPLEIAMRALSFVGLVVVTGTLAFLLLVWSPAANDRSVPPESVPVAGTLPLLRWARWGALAFTLGVVGWWLQALARLPDPGIRTAVGTQFMASLAARGLIGMLLVVALSAAVGTGRDRTREHGVVVAAIGSFLAIGAASAGGHASARGGLGGLLVDAVHLVGVTVWVGGLIAITRITPWFRDEQHAVFAVALLGRFSNLAAVTVTLVVGAGALLGAILVGGLEGLTTTAYGWILAAKVLLLVPMLLVGWTSRTRLAEPRVKGRPERTTSASLARVIRNVRFETALGAVVIALATLLTTLNPGPPPDAAEAPYVVTATVEDTKVALTVAPRLAGPGTYRFTLEVSDLSTGEVHPIEDGFVTLAPLNASVPVATLPVVPGDGGRATVRTSAMDLPGVWRVETVLTTGPHEPTKATFYLALVEG